jgi:hypothetical protein
MKNTTENWLNLKGPDDDVQHSESLGLWTLSIVQISKYLENAMFQKLDLCPSSGEGRETPALSGSSKSDNFNH